MPKVTIIGIRRDIGNQFLGANLGRNKKDRNGLYYANASFHIGWWRLFKLHVWKNNEGNFGTYYSFFSFSHRPWIWGIIGRGEKNPVGSGKHIMRGMSFRRSERW